MNGSRPEDVRRRSAESDEIRYIAIIGDLIGSRSLKQSVRAKVQERLEHLLDELNRRYVDAVLAKWVITVGDEFQGLLEDPEGIPDILWDLEIGLAEVSEVGIRFGIGCGGLETPLKEFAIGMDGPAWHAAREALEKAEADDRLGGVFRGFGETGDRILDGLARILHHMRSRMTDRQRETVQLLRTGSSQAEVARQLDVTPQAINNKVRAVGWEAYWEGEEAWRAALVEFNVSSHGRNR